MFVRQLYTAGGVRMDEAASALQKCVRQGREFEAAYWAQELESKFYKYVWRRLEVIAQEDVGLADPQAMLIVAACKAYYFECRANGELNSLPLVNATLYLSRAPKSRLADNVCALIYCNPTLKLEVPDDALDLHTERGRAMGRGAAHFLEHGAKLVPEAEEVDPYKPQVQELAKKMTSMKDLALREWVVNARRLLRAKKGGADVEEEVDRADATLF